MVQDEESEGEYNMENQSVCKIYETIPLGIRILIDQFVQKYNLEFFFQNALVKTYSWIQQYDQTGHESLAVSRRIKRIRSSYVFNTLNNHQITCEDSEAELLGQCNEYQLLLLTGFTHFFPVLKGTNAYYDNILDFLHNLYSWDQHTNLIDPSLRHLWLQVYHHRRKVLLLFENKDIPTQLEQQRAWLVDMINL